MRGERTTSLRGRATGAAILLVLLSAGLGTRGQPTEQEPPDEQPAAPFDSGIVERSGVTLMLLDVEVLDKRGNPVPGLRREDFVVVLNGRELPLYSLDDLCTPPSAASEGRIVETGGDRPSAPGQPGVAEAPNADPGPLAPGPEGTSALPAEETRFILYMDYSQLTPFGRANAVETGRRWIRETMQPGERVQIAAYASLPGLKRLTPFTSDKNELLAALEAADADPQLVDPFPSALWLRIDECNRCCHRAAEDGCYCNVLEQRCCPVCYFNARDEYVHGKHSLEALNRYLRSLESVPGRKELLLFHEHGTLFPARFYPEGEAPEIRVGQQLLLADESGAEANLSRTRIHTLYSGVADSAGTFINLGANLAEFTGGSYSRGNVDMSRVAQGAGRGSSCIYRIGLRRPDDWKDGISRAVVWARDRSLPYRYRVQFLDEVDRWWRRSQAVLADPDNYSALDVGTAVLPLGVSDKGWDLAVQVAVDANSLMLFPSAGRQQGDWEVGALLTRGDGGKYWEMLGRSRLSHTGSDLPGDIILHERRFSGLKPGTYQLGAFVRDRTANEFGGARTTLALPRPGRDSLAGPIPLAVDRRRIVSSLPLLKGDAGDNSRSDSVAPGPVPLAASGAPVGQTLEFGTWICPGKNVPTLSRLVRFVSTGGEPLFRMSGAQLRQEGPCMLMIDRVETSLLEAGDYTYHFRWNREEGEPIENDVGFRLVATAAAGPLEPEVSRVEAEAEPAAPAGAIDATIVGEPGPAADVHASAPGEPPRDPELVRLQHEILARMANVARLYRDNALRFTCDETILFGGRGKPILHKFRYLYRFSESEQALRDYRVPRGGGAPDQLSEAEQVRLDNYGLPVFLLRAYSWIFIFHADNQPLYRYDLRGESEALGRPAWRIDFEPVPPVLPSHNDWYGSAWIDRETHQLLLVEAQRPEDREQDALLHAALQKARQSGRDSYHGTYSILSYTTDFDVEKNGMRFPGRSVIDKTDFQVRGGGVVKQPVYHVSQTYKRYRFFGVRTAAEIRTIVEGP